jgi:hypothetical protein
MQPRLQPRLLLHRLPVRFWYLQLVYFNCNHNLHCPTSLSPFILTTNIHKAVVSAVPIPPGSPSLDGTCGANSPGGAEYTCAGSSFGTCCSVHGWCGNDANYCNPTAGCQPGFGTCSLQTGPVISPDGTCGVKAGAGEGVEFVCLGSPYGNCCSVHGWCGELSNLYCSKTPI